MLSFVNFCLIFSVPSLATRRPQLISHLRNKLASGNGMDRNNRIPRSKVQARFIVHLPLTQEPVDIRDETSLAIQHLPCSLSQEFLNGGMVIPKYLDTHFICRSLRKRPQYACGYSKAHDLISICFHCSSPSYIDLITNLNIKHRTIIFNRFAVDVRNTMDIHSGYLDYLINPRYNFLIRIMKELECINTVYDLDTLLSSKTRLLITGQSLGGALAQLFYLLLFTDSDCIGPKLQETLKELIPSDLKNAFVITFGSPSFMYCGDVEKHFKSSDGDLHALNQRIFNFHIERDPIPLLLTGNQERFQTKHVGVGEVIRNDPVRRLEIASNSHLGHNLALVGSQCVHMEQDVYFREKLENGAHYLWNNEVTNMRELLISFATHHWPHQYHQKVRRILEG